MTAKYWSSTEVVNSTVEAYGFLFGFGHQITGNKASDLWKRWAVRDGDAIPAVVQVDIDIKPGSDPNCFNINGHGVIPVAILGSNTFNVLDLDTSALYFAGLEVRMRGKKGPLCHGEDSNGDGYLDLVCQFEDDSSMWAPDSSAEATIAGTLHDGTIEFEGTGAICVDP